MAFRFWYELIIGIITLVSLLIFGEKGITALVLLAFLPIIYRMKKIKPDERETQLFFRGTQYIVNAIAAVILVSVFIFRIKITDLMSISTVIFYFVMIVILILVSVLRLYLHYKN
ncbi:MAG: hypothetical protein HXY50_15600 [Ignavibacteriaceae bacterium]|nr:hypothetical protein [Ignavibacteriaceae bacterium]